jgi:putative chitinase
MNPEQIAACTGARIDRANRFAPYLSAGMAFYGIDTPQRQAAFLAQVGHESGGLKYVSEICGHGLIQTTGRKNHALVRDRLRQRFIDVPDFELEPEALMDHQWASLSACDYWDMKHLNAFADAGDFEGITLRINGGLNGYEDRCERWEYGKRALGCMA